MAISRKWKPNFRADNDKVNTAIIWVRILNLPMELFKIDGNTFNATRGKFARFCIQIQLDVPLELGICVDGTIYQVVYENLPSVCYTCGSAGHHTKVCEVKDQKTQAPKAPKDANDSNAEQLEPHQNSSVEWLVEKAKPKDFGDWMTVQRKKKPNSIWIKSQNNSQDPGPSNSKNKTRAEKTCKETGYYKPKANSNLTRADNAGKNKGKETAEEIVQVLDKNPTQKRKTVTSNKRIIPKLKILQTP